MNAYKVVQSESFQDLIDILYKYQDEYHSKLNHPNDEDGAENYYYEIRQYDRNDDWPKNKSDVERAARMIFLNKTCYNGLYRVNNKGQFNTPIGRYRNPLICDKENIVDIHNYLSDKNNNICIMCDSYDKAISKAECGDIIYVDPPYDYEDDDGFTKYQMAGFSFDDFIKLKNSCERAIDKGATVIISNNATEKVIDLFGKDPKYKINYLYERLTTLRSINSNGEGRHTGNEVIILGAQNVIPQANDMSKIIKIIMLKDDKLLNDKKTIKEKLDITERQVLYYLQALQYLKYITQSQEFTDRAKKICNDEKDVKKDIYKQLYENKLFLDVYKNARLNNNKIDNNFIKEKMDNMNLNLAKSTIDRRSSTIKSGVKWMIKYKS